MIAALLPKDLEYLPTYEAYRQAFLDRHKRRREADQHGRDFDEAIPEPSKQLLDQLSHRLRWEVVRELGLASRIGRTLEQSACVSVAVDESRFALALEEIQRDVPERVGCVQDVQAPAWRAFVGGLITRLRRGGAVFDPMLEGFILSGGQQFKLSREQQPLLSPFGQHTGRPKFLCNGGSRHFDLIASGKRNTWYGDWATRALGVPLGPSDVSDLYAEILKVLVSRGILGHWPLGKHEVWGLLPEALRVSRRHVFRCCAHCGMEIAAVKDSPLDPLYQPCLKYRCEGTLEERGPKRTKYAQSYYQRFYERGILGRVWSEEHTGLLERTVREDLELEFKERPRPDAPNLLSCTPTLEMGIDIGDLSATLLCAEIGYLRAEVYAIIETGLFGWLCDRSLLPNYAFPEPGVTLNAFVRGEENDKNAKDGEGTPTQSFSWIRAPSTAIRELAPFNTFYGSGVRVVIDNVDLRASSQEKGSKVGSVVTWQFCKSCHHMAPVPENATETNCPSCGDTGWQEAGRRRKLVRMSQVRAFARRRDALFGDEAEQRQREYYETINFYDVNDAKPKDAWCNEAIGFGFELLPNVVLRRVNFGQSTFAAPTTQLGGRFVPDISFLVCEECGQVRSEPKKAKTGHSIRLHRGNCTAKSKTKHQPTPIHLYRELKSAAIRLLLPFSTEEAKKREANVRAALRLGLKTLCGGDPEFLGVDIYDQPHAGNDQARRRYLIIQDMVPGGAGLLAELASAKGAKLKVALELSLNRLRRCACNKREPAVRACYQCLYAYREQNDLHLLDRDTACGLLETMLEAFSDLTKVQGGLAGVSIDSLLESELERRLHSQLVNLAGKDAEFQVTPLENEVLDIQVAGRHWRVTPEVYRSSQDFGTLSARSID